MKVSSNAENSRTHCDDCGHTVAASASFCTECGSSVKKCANEVKPVPEPCVAQAEETPTHEPVLPLVGPNAPSDQPQSANCGSCGAELCANAKFCQECGVRVGEKRPVVRLTIHQTDKEPREVDLDGELLIGKSAECGLTIDDSYLSHRHSRIYSADGLLYLEDLASANGTFLRVRRPIVLDIGDEIVVGTTVLKVTEED